MKLTERSASTISVRNDIQSFVTESKSSKKCYHSVTVVILVSKQPQNIWMELMEGSANKISVRNDIQLIVSEWQSCNNYY